MTNDQEFAAKGSNFAYRENMTNSDAVHTPDADALRRQMTKLLEAAIAKLPESFRLQQDFCFGSLADMLACMKASPLYP